MDKYEVREEARYYAEEAEQRVLGEVNTLRAEVEALRQQIERLTEIVQASR